MSRVILAAILLSSVALASQAIAGGTGWSCRTCGYSNGTAITGLHAREAVSVGVMLSIVLSSGETVHLN